MGRRTRTHRKGAVGGVVTDAPALRKPPNRPLLRAQHDFLMSMDFHLRQGERNRAKIVATRWQIIEAQTVHRTANRWKKKCAEFLGKKPAKWWRLGVDQHCPTVMLAKAVQQRQRQKAVEVLMRELAAGARRM